MSSESFVKLNIVTLSGEVISSPNARESRGGDSYTVFTLSVGPVGPTRPFRIAVVAEGALAQRCNDSLKRGCAVIVEGALRGAPGRSQALRMQANRVQVRDEDGSVIDLSLPAASVVSAKDSAAAVVVEVSEPSKPAGESKSQSKSKSKSQSKSKSKRSSQTKTKTESSAKRAGSTSESSETQHVQEGESKQSKRKTSRSRRKPRVAVVGSAGESAPVVPAAKTVPTTDTSKAKATEEKSPSGSARASFGRGRRPVKLEIPVETIALAETVKRDEALRASAKRTSRKPSAKAGASKAKAKSVQKPTSVKSSSPKSTKSTKKPVKPIKKSADRVTTSEKPSRAVKPKSTETRKPAKPARPEKAKKQERKVKSSSSVSDSPFALREVEESFDPFMIGDDD